MSLQLKQVCKLKAWAEECLGGSQLAARLAYTRHLALYYQPVYTVQSVHFPVDFAESAVYNVQCAVYNVQFTMYNVQCIMYIVQCTANTVLCFTRI